MPGIRLHHPTLRAGEGTTLTYVVELPQPMLTQRTCQACLKVHANKAIHLRLDAEGDVIVSPEVYVALQSAFLGGMEVVNEVPNPPPMFLGAVEKDKERIVEMPLNRDTASAPLITPSRSKYENRDRLLKGLAALLKKEN